MSHTPGPWYLSKPQQILAAEGHQVVAVVGMAGKPLKEIHANGYLVAAALELLEAGRAAIRLCEMWERGQLKKTPAYTALKAAIAKADGDHDLHG